jgi:hypothetical protein
VQESPAAGGKRDLATGRVLGGVANYLLEPGSGSGTIVGVAALGLVWRLDDEGGDGVVKTKVGCWRRRNCDGDFSRTDPQLIHEERVREKWRKDNRGGSAVFEVFFCVGFLFGCRVLLGRRRSGASGKCVPKRELGNECSFRADAAGWGS